MLCMLSEKSNVTSTTLILSVSGILFNALITSFAFVPLTMATMLPPKPMSLLVAHYRIDLTGGKARLVNTDMRTNVFRKYKPLVGMFQF